MNRAVTPGGSSELPQSAKPIYVEWPIKEGGVCAYAWIDDKRHTYLSVGNLNRIGKSTGSPNWFRCQKLKVDMVVGFTDDRPLVMNIALTANTEGLALTVRMPREVTTIEGFVERRFAPWGSPPPSYVLR